MTLFLELICIVCVAALLLSYVAYRRCLRPEHREKTAEAVLRRQANIFTAIMLLSVIVLIAAVLILRTLN